MTQLHAKTDVISSREKTDPIRFLVVGDIRRLPVVEGVAYTPDPHRQCDAIALAGGFPASRLYSELEEVLADARHTCLPVADFSGAHIPRADYSAADPTEENILEACGAVESIVERARQLPAMPDRGDRDALLALAGAALRDGRIQAHWAPDKKEAVTYPLLLGLPRQQRILESLSDMGLLRREFFDRTHVCRHCGGSRLNTREECERCRSSHLREASLVHHFNCAYQGPETEFQSGDGLQCPKCGRPLRHYGVDYDKPGVVVACSACGHRAPETLVGFVCLDCEGHTSAEQADTREWFHYGLLGDGEVAVRRGRLPQVSMEELIEGLATAQEPRSFALLLDHHCKLNERYGRPVSAWLIIPRGMEELSERIGSRDSAEAFRIFVEQLDQTLRLTDAVTAAGGSIVVLLPETDHRAGDKAATRLRERVAATLTEELAFDIQTYEGQRTRDILEFLR